MKWNYNRKYEYRIIDWSLDEFKHKGYDKGNSLEIDCWIYITDFLKLGVSAAL